ncbi:hypothetical protein BTO15_12475 [Polaribacter sejongensis]|uniref:HTH cro/C1-type domain-containing protein n=2 Tax=Polaribacter sejongensis TaxID=985043 RepID=A0ABN5F8M3_9FLAO|nr:helix-turn-helix domain-containing protein [Polaribacter sejongensis]AUC22854.1 hypothetical protein BTO15_12475 [Polaribacter sejongensis]
MKQPELGKRIFELRKRNGLTQEELVEQCNINVRTIQRIEAGEVNPRSYTIKIILEVLGEDLQNINESSLDEKNVINWTNTELKSLNKSWVFGVFYSIITLIGILMEVYFTTHKVSGFWLLVFRIPYVILFFLFVIPFLKGYKIIAQKFNNTLLIKAIYIYFGIAILISFATFFMKSNGFIGALEIAIGVFLMMIFGVGELIMGLGILGLKENLGSFAQVTGIVKIVNGIMAITLILWPVALFLIIPILILETFFLNDTFKTCKDSIIHDDTAHSLK